MQVLKEAQAVDKKYEAGEDIKPLCGLAFVVKDNLDVLGETAVAVSPAAWGATRHIIAQRLSYA